MGDKQNRLDENGKKKGRKSGVAKGPHGVGSDPEK
jgi:hypothetical protein